MLHAPTNGNGVVNLGSQGGGDDINDINDFTKVIIHTYNCQHSICTISMYLRQAHCQYDVQLTVYLLLCLYTRCDTAAAFASASV
jgi:hypothetical protein